MTPSGQGPFFHPKDAMRHNVDISGAWTTFVLDKSEGFTQAGVERINDSIRTYVWAILGAQVGGWSGGAKVLGKLSVPGRPTTLDCSRARAYCACSRCGWGLFGHFFSHLSLLFSFSLSLADGPI